MPGEGREGIWHPDSILFRPQEALKLLQTLLAHEPFACKLDAGAMLTSQCELEARLKVCVGEEGGGGGRCAC